jgi:hypothetical protein
MALEFAAGDNLIFQLESGYGLIRILAVEERDGAIVWHVSVYEEFYPDVETAEAALEEHSKLELRRAHLALTDRALSKTPAARLSNHPVTEDELTAYHEWISSGAPVSDRSVLLMLGLR